MLRNRNRHDLYLFGHGADFRGALRDFTAVGGAVPLPCDTSWACSSPAGSITIPRGCGRWCAHATSGGCRWTV
eukprot:scaffold46847_cov152-Isochrysis_galbana.AAC.1